MFSLLVCALLSFTALAYVKGCLQRHKSTRRHVLKPMQEHEPADWLTVKL